MIDPRRLVRHVAIPALAPMALVALYFTPLTVISCRHRGLLAFGIALAAGLAGVVTGVRGLTATHRRDPAARWWMLSTAILALALVLLLGPLG